MAPQRVTNRRDPDDPEPALQCKYRGQYETARFTTPRILFFVVRLAAVAVCYSILAKPGSSLSIYRLFPAAEPAYPVPETYPHIPLLPNGIVASVADYLEMTPSATLILFMIVGMSAQFVMYDLVWRRERMPLTGDGGAVEVSLATFVIDVLTTLFFVYFSGRNPTWSNDLVDWTFWPFSVGLVLQMSSDKIKADFKSSGPTEGEGKLLARGPWGIVRNPNYTGFHLWKLCMGIALFGWAIGFVFGWLTLRPTLNASIPSIEWHLGRKYGAQFEDYRRKVPFRLVPGVY